MPDEKNEQKPKTVVILKNFFGVKEGQKLTDFANEIKELTDEDKLQLATGIEDGSLNY